MVPTSAVFTVTQPTLGIGTISADYTPPAGLATYSPSIFFDSLVFDLNNYLSEYTSPISGSSYKLDGVTVDGYSGKFDQYVQNGAAPGVGTLFQAPGGNWTIPANDSDFFTQYVATFDGSGPTPGPSIRYQVAKTTTIYDGDFYVKTFGYGDQDIPADQRVPGVYVLNDDPAPDPSVPVYYEAGGYPTSRPLTAFGYRPGSNKTVGWGKTGRCAYTGTATVAVGFIYENATVNTFRVYAYRRFYTSGAQNVCDLYLLIGHTRWNSVFGTVTYSASDFGQQQSAQLKVSGSTNVLAVTMLLSNTAANITVGQLQSVVQNLTNRMRLFFYF
jgi:hypothetical protein